MGKYRTRFNAKARSGMISKQEKLKKARNKHLNDTNQPSSSSSDPSDPSGPSIDSNAEILLPLTNEEKQQRKRKLNELIKPKDTKISNAKKKRLDKYIDNQVKKQEKEQLFKKLDKYKVNGDNQMISMKILGTGKGAFKRKKEKEESYSEDLTDGEDGDDEEVSSLEHSLENSLVSHPLRSHPSESHPSENHPNTKLEKTPHNDTSDGHILHDDTLDENTLDEDSSLRKQQLNESIKNQDENQETDPSPDAPTSSFIDHRPQNGSKNFNFQNLKKLNKSIPKKKYNWRQRLEKEKAMRQGREMDSESEETDSEEEDESEDQESEDEDEDIGEQENSDDNVENVKKSNKSLKSVRFAENIDEKEDGQSASEDEASDNDLSDNDNDNDSSKNESEELDSSDASDSALTPAPKSSAIFKQWTDSLNPPAQPLIYPQNTSNYTPLNRSEDNDDLPQEISNESNPSRKSFYVNVVRSEQIQSQRLDLPVCSEEQQIMESLNNNDCVVICGETGSGKTTQVPQFLFEAGYGNPSSPDTPGMIGITQPRRVAAVSMAKRVGEELGDHENAVGYQIRFDSKVSDDTRVKFMTDGVLLRELMTDLTLSKYSAIIIDEAHERNINTDILIGVLSRVLALRRSNGSNPLKLIIMSATLRVSDFIENPRLFKKTPPVINVSARQFPVSIHFSRKTKFEYIDEAYNKAVKIHQRLPPGGILIFMTGQNEINQLVKKLRKSFPSKSNQVESRVQINANEATIEAEEIDFGDDAMDFDEIDKLESSDDEAGSSDDEAGSSDVESNAEEGFEEASGVIDTSPLHVLPLYSMLPTDQQMKVFQNPPKGSRLCVIATNVAETSLTIPNIRYVVDTGRVKERQYDEDTKIQRFQVNWTSKASADQRAGRAGRTGPGHCYRLYSSAVYEADFQQFTEPEILRMPIDGLVLQMKAMGIDNIVNFPFPTAPSRVNLNKGLMVLRYLRALDTKDQLTSLGKAMSVLPLSPRYAKMVSIGDQLGCLPYVLALVSILSVGDPFLNEQELGIGKEEDESESQHDFDDKETVEDKKMAENRRKLRSKRNEAHSKFCTLNSTCDAFRFLSVVCSYDYVTSSPETFCRQHFLRFKTMEEIKKLRHQLGHLVAVYAFPRDSDLVEKKLSSKLEPPSSQQLNALRQIIAAGFIDQVAIRADIVNSDIPTRSKKNIGTFPYKTVFPVVQQTNSTEHIDPYVYLHSSSMINNLGKTPPDYLVFDTIQQSQSHKEGHAPNIRIKPLVDISASELSNLAKETPLITYSKPLGPPYAPKAINSVKRECWVIPRFGAALGFGGVGWDLPARKVIQKKEGSEWTIESYL